MLIQLLDQLCARLALAVDYQLPFWDEILVEVLAQILFVVKQNPTALEPTWCATSGRILPNGQHETFLQWAQAQGYTETVRLINEIEQARALQRVQSLTQMFDQLRLPETSTTDTSAQQPTQNTPTYRVFH